MCGIDGIMSEEWSDACSTDDSNTTEWDFDSEESPFSSDPLRHPSASQENSVEDRIVRRIDDPESPDVDWYDKAFHFSLLQTGALCIYS